MAVTKIHPIKSTLHYAMDYITDAKKTDGQLLITGGKCNPATACTQFLRTRDDLQPKGNVLARHLIQSFAPGEATPEQAHQIGLELCKNVLGDDYEFVLSTHVDKGHIHNHIIFNNVNLSTGKCYRSNKKSYHKLRSISDRLCKENNLSVIDEFYESFRKKYRTNGRGWYENEQHKQGKSWKSRLQFDIDRATAKAADWDDFLRLMREYGYEIKAGKHISFRYSDKKDSGRFTRAKTIGEDYTEENLRKRIAENVAGRNKTAQEFRKKRRSKSVENIIDLNKSPKAKDSKGYEIWASW